jgi:hypothetical protein
MPAFPSRPLNKSPLYLRLKRHPALFGVPFLLVMVGASFGLQTFTQTRYDLQSQKVTQVRAPPPPPIVFFVSNRRFPTDEPRTGARARSESKEVRRP